MKSSAPTVWLTTLGCAKNQVDSEKVAAMLGGAGYGAAGSPADADVVMVNTCAFIEDARRESVDTILELAEARRDGANLVILGCMAQRYEAQLVEALPEADAVIGLDRYGELVDRLDVLTGWQPLRIRPAPSSKMDILYQVARPTRDTPYAYVKIAEGCDKACTFCAIPLIRGKQRSRSPVNVRQEMTQLAGGGITEVVLVAQDLAAYGRDLGAPGGLVELLRFVSDVEGIRRLRLFYLYPREIRPALIEEMAGNPLIADYFDLSLQHATARLLRAMKRPGDGGRYLDLIGQIREATPDAALRSSFIVGFPGETEDEVEELADFLRSAQLDWAGFFPFSAEEGTAAATMAGLDDRCLARDGGGEDRAPPLSAQPPGRHHPEEQRRPSGENRRGAGGSDRRRTAGGPLVPGGPRDRRGCSARCRPDRRVGQGADHRRLRHRYGGHRGRFGMIVEVLAVGTELLLGQTVNTNATEIGRLLADAGMDHYHQSVVGDNTGRIAAAIHLAMKRADVLIITGGIGPTPDDLTREAICEGVGVQKAFSDEYAERLRQMWAARGREMPESNLRQAEYPEGAQLIPNPKGTAPGLRLLAGETWIFAVPGVPAEMMSMLQDEVIPFLTSQTNGEGAAVVSRVLHTWGESESRVGELLADLYEGSRNPTIAFLSSAGEIRVRLTAKAGSEEEARSLIAPLEEQIRRRLGAMVFAVDGDTVAGVLLGLLEQRSWTLGTAESATGGMVAAAVTSVPGSSRVFRGSIVAYAEDAKEELLAVPGDVMARHGVVSEEVALAMARGAAEELGVDVAIAVTGSAGPEPQDKPAGTMVIAVLTPVHVAARTMQLPGDRERVRTYTTTAALHLARLGVVGDWWSGAGRGTGTT